MGDLILFPQKAKEGIKSIDEIDSYDELTGYLMNNTASNYTVKQAEKLADTILKVGNHFNIQTPPPIVNITKQFGFSVYNQPNMKANESGNIYIGKRAHELGHYLMDYLGQDDNSKKLFSKVYLKNNYDSSNEELRADKFAVELLGG